MSWKRLLESGQAAAHEPSRLELENLRRVVRRNLADAKIIALHPDTRFRLAYEAGLISAKMAIACAGYRIKGHGIHGSTFAALELAMGEKAKDAAAFFDRCRRTRNVIDYVRADVVTVEDAKDVLAQSKRLHTAVESWIRRTRPDLSRRHS